MKKRHFYTKEEDKFLIENHKTMFIKELAEVIGVDEVSIKNRFQILKLKPKRIQIYSDDGTKKRCSLCEKYKELDKFNLHNGKPRSRCRACENGNPNVEKSKKHIYSKEEVDFLKDNHKTMLAKEMADALNLPVVSVRAKLASLKLKTIKNHVYSDDGTQKRCPRCMKFKDLNEFSTAGNKISSKCKICAYEYHLERRERLNPINLKPTFEELIKKSRTGKRFCTICKEELNANNSIIRFSSSKQVWEINTRCKACNNRLSTERKLKRIAERGY